MIKKIIIFGKCFKTFLDLISDIEVRLGGNFFTVAT